MLNAKGGVIGMSVFGPRRRVLVIPAATIERVAAQLAAHGRMPRGYLGLSLQPVKVNHASVGAMVMGVAEQGPGAAAGIHQGDIIVAVNGEPIRSVQLLLRALGPASVGSRPRAVASACGRAGRGPAHRRRKASRLNESRAMKPITVAIEIDDAELAHRLAAALAAAPDLRLAAPGEAADVLLVHPSGVVEHGETVDSVLTPRELEVLALVAEGASNKTVARRLGISVHTAKFHVGSLIDKLDATGRTDAVTQAARLGVIHL